MTKENEEINNEYLCGLFDAEGCVGVGIRTSPSGKLYPQPQLVLNLKDKYFAGFFDGDGCVGMSVTEDYYFPNGLHVLPALRIGLKTMQSNYDLLKKIEEEYGGHTNQGRDMVIWRALSLEDVSSITDILLAYCYIKRPHLLIIKEITELIQAGEQLTPEGLYYILLLTEKLKKLNTHKHGSRERDWLEVLKKKVGVIEYQRIECLFKERERSSRL